MDMVVVCWLLANNIETGGWFFGWYLGWMAVGRLVGKDGIQA